MTSLRSISDGADMAVVKQYLPYATSGSGFQASNERVLFRGIGEHDAPVMQCTETRL